MQRIDPAHDRQHRQQFVIAVHDELTPCPLHRQRFHGLPVRGQSAMLDKATRFEMRDRLAIRHAVEGHRQIERVRLHSQIGAGERDALGFAGQLKVRRRGLQ